MGQGTWHFLSFPPEFPFFSLKLPLNTYFVCLSTVRRVMINNPACRLKDFRVNESGNTEQWQPLWNEGGRRYQFYQTGKDRGTNLDRKRGFYKVSNFMREKKFRVIYSSLSPFVPQLRRDLSGLQLLTLLGSELARRERKNFRENKRLLGRKRGVLIPEKVPQMGGSEQQKCVSTSSGGQRSYISESPRGKYSPGCLLGLSVALFSLYLFTLFIVLVFVSEFPLFIRISVTLY